MECVLRSQAGVWAAAWVAPGHAEYFVNRVAYTCTGRYRQPKQFFHNVVMPSVLFQSDFPFRNVTESAEAAKKNSLEVS